MKRKMTLSLVLTMSMLTWLPSFALMAKGQTPGDNVNMRKVVADTDVLTLGPNQKLRLTVTGDWNGDGFAIRFRQAAYMPLGCNNDDVCKHSIASQSLSAPVMLNPGESASMDIANSLPVRVIVLSNSQNVRVNAMIIDTTTGNIICVLVGLIVPGPH